MVSKSGRTTETHVNEQFLRRRFAEKGLGPTRHLVAVTEEDSPMDSPKRYRSLFYMWDFVGGRYSVSSMVGGVALSFAMGIKLWSQLLEGAYQMDQVALRRDPHQNLPLFSVLLTIWNRNFLQPTFPRSSQVIPYIL